MGPLFSFEGVGVVLEGVEVLAGVDLELPEGGCTVLVGPSGGGKSTLLRLCNRLDAPTTGVVRFRGDDVAGLDPLCHRRRVGMVFQRPVAFGGTVLDNLRVARPDVTEGEAAEALDRVGLRAAFLGREQVTLSGGEGQRACLARTLLAQPEVLLLDEPTASLDAAAAAGLERLACDLAAQGTSLLGHPRPGPGRAAGRPHRRGRERWGAGDVEVTAHLGVVAAAGLLAADAEADTGPVGPAGLAASLVLVVVVVAVSRWRRLGLGRDVVVTCALALVQLLLVGVGLGLVIGDDRPLWPSWLWVGGMLLYAAWVTTRRAPEVRGLFGLALVALAAALAVSLGVVFGLGVFRLTTRTLVPTAGLIVGNALTSAVVVARRTVEDLRDKRDEVEARLALGLPAEQAARPHVRSALRTALSPQIERTRAVGLVALPGAMTGLLLAGVDPLVAVAVQAVVMYLVLGSAAVVGAVLALGMVRRLFTADHRLRPLPRPADAA